MKVKEICEVMNCAFSIYAYDIKGYYPKHLRLCKNGLENTFCKNIVTRYEQKPFTFSLYIPKEQWVFIKDLPTFEQLMEMEVHSIMNVDRDSRTKELIVTVDIPLVDKDGGLIDNGTA